MSDKIEVDKKALVRVLQALVGPPHLIRELIVLRDNDHRGISLELSPIGVLVQDFNAAKDEN